MNYYVKVNPKVAVALSMATPATQLPDGNYLVLPRQMTTLGLGGFAQMTSICAKTGSLYLTSPQARDEQQNIASLPLPEAELERFRVDPPLTMPGEGLGEIVEEILPALPPVAEEVETEVVEEAEKEETEEEEQEEVEEGGED